MMTRLQSTFCFLLALGFLLPACGGTGDGDPIQPGTELRSEEQRITAPSTEPSDVAAQVAGNTAFALDLYAQVREGSDAN